MTPFDQKGRVHAACRQPLLDAALSFPPASSCLASPTTPHSLIHFLFGVYHLASILSSTLSTTLVYNMPVLEKNVDHESNRDLEREKDRDREGKDREKGPKTKSSTKGGFIDFTIFVYSHDLLHQPRISPMYLASSSRWAPVLQGSRVPSPT